MSAEQAGGTPGSGAMSDRLRALLSRAAEEQLSEQRQVSAVLADLRALLERVDERLATGDQVERISAEVRALSARLDAAQTRTQELADHVAAATGALDRVVEDVVTAVVSQVAELLGHSERRTGSHVDDAVVALAEVVLARRSGAVPPTAGPAEPRRV